MFLTMVEGILASPDQTGLLKRRLGYISTEQGEERARTSAYAIFCGFGIWCREALAPSSTVIGMGR